MRISRRLLLAGTALAPLGQGSALANVIIGTTGIVSFAIQSVSPASANFAAGSPDGTVVAAISVQMSPGAPVFNGTLSISGPDSFRFRLSSTTLPSNILLNGSQGAGTYSINLIASMAGITNSPFTQPVTITGGAFVVAITDGGGGTVTYQADAINHWPDGSVRFCSISAYTSRPIAIPGGFDTHNISVNGTFITSRAMNSFEGCQMPAGKPVVYGVGFKQGDIPAGTSFNNTLPGGQTVASLLSALQSFPGAQDLTLEVGNVNSASGASGGRYNSGDTWQSHFNAAAAGSFVQVWGKGPVNLTLVVFDGFKAISNNGGAGVGSYHAHLHTVWFVTLWLNSSGSILDVEYSCVIQNGLCTGRNIDGSAVYSTFPIDRYNYNPAFKNGGTTIVNNTDPSMLLVTGTPTTIGGHPLCTSWATLRTDAKQRWIAGTLEDTNLTVSYDQIQDNPQTITAARDYLGGVGIMGHYGVRDIDCQTNSLIAPYSPLGKFVNNGSFVSATDTTDVTGGGNGPNIAMIDGNEVRHFYLQLDSLARNNRCASVWTVGSYQLRGIDVNGRIPNILGYSISSLTAPQPTSVLPVGPFTENVFSQGPGSGGWGHICDTTHYPGESYYPYIFEGRALWAWYLIQDAFWPACWASPYPTNGLNPYINRTPTYQGTTWNGNAATSGYGDRMDAWTIRGAVLAAAVLPDALADGSVFGETLQFKGIISATYGYANQIINNVMTPNWRNIGCYFFAAEASNQDVPMVGNGQAMQKPWQQAYLMQVSALCGIIHGGETGGFGYPGSLGGSIAGFIAFNRRYAEGLANDQCSAFINIQDIVIKTNFGTISPPSLDYFPDWTHVGTSTGATAPNGSGGATNGGENTQAAFIDTSGWIYLYGSNPAGPYGWIDGPLGVGDIVFFFQGGQGPFDFHLPPSPFQICPQQYRVVAAEPTNGRLQVCLATDSSNTVITPSTTGNQIGFAVAHNASCPAAYYPDYSGQAGPPGTLRAAVNFQGDLAQGWGQLLSIRYFRRYSDTSRSASADAIATSRLVNIMVGGSVRLRSFLSNRPDNWITFP